MPGKSNAPGRASGGAQLSFPLVAGGLTNDVSSPHRQARHRRRGHGATPPCWQCAAPVAAFETARGRECLRCVLQRQNPGGGAA